ncbi:hypothetical protein GCM10009690_17810 [Brevibacterium permense]|uniref:Uncharacterized protein n=1 Tax=Brevibacterium permense TaxID=234834 RepID=A0ABN2ACE8_9MICO
MDDVDSELVEFSHAIGFRSGFDQSGSDELEEDFVIDDVESEASVNTTDRVDEDPRPAGLHDC